MSRQESSNVLIQEEVDDIWYLLEACYRSKEIKGVNICLELLDSEHHCPEKLLKQNLKDSNIKLLGEILENEVDIDTSFEITRTLAKKIVLKIENGKINEQTLKEHKVPISEIENNEICLAKTFDQPPSLRVCLFQLAESNDLERVTFILQTISKYPQEELLLMRKSGIVRKVIKVLQKYCNGDYGFDQEISKLGNFQYCMVHCLIALSESFTEFDEFLKEGVITMLGQIVEESFIYIYDKTINAWMEWNNRLSNFVSEALNFFELAVNVKCTQYYQEMRKLYKILKERISGLTPKELNIVKICKTFFPDKGINMIEILDCSEDAVKCLKMACPVLYNTFIKINELIVKLDAMKEYSETHQDKYCKLFSLDQRKKMNVDKENDEIQII